MHVSSIVPVTSSQPPSPGKSKFVPPGLAKRGLDLPPGIARKLAAGGTAPAGIAKRFPTAALQVTPTSETTGTETGGATPPVDASSQGNTTASVDLLV